MPKPVRSYLIVPAAGAGEGMGHLARCLGLAEQMGPHVTFLTTRMDSAARALLSTVISRMPAHARPRVLQRLSGSYEIILVDARASSQMELEQLMRHGLVVSMDEGGEAARYASFLVDAIPGLPGTRPANRTSVGFLPLPRRARSAITLPPKKVLISFGGEDREDLSGKLLDRLLLGRVFRCDQITVVEGPLFGVREWPAGITLVRGSTGLGPMLSDFDLVITHFGITAFESLAVGVPVILLNPSRYHEKLAHAAGIPSLGVASPDMRRLRRLLARPAELATPVTTLNAALGKERGKQLGRLLETLQVHGSAQCPVCGRGGNAVTARFEDRTYRKCPRCGIVSLESFATHQMKYGEEYFSSEYKAQYGRTYLEDFDAIKRASVPRVRLVKELSGKNVDGAVVDIGCAYGPFLDAAREAGLPGYGVDVSSGAVSYVRKKLGIPALCASFESVARGSLPRRIRAITMWYVIEHFTGTDLVLRKAASLLPPGGVFAFSTPNGRGISGRLDPLRFLKNSPADHFTVFSPRGLRRLLSGYGLELRAVRVTGHHPERFPGILGRSADQHPGLYRLVRGMSKLFGLGDTFEAYAVKAEQ